MNLELEEFTSCQSNQANQTFEIINTGTVAVNLSQLTIKFWQDDTNYVSTPADTMVGVINYGGCFGSSCTAVTGVAISSVNFSPACGPVPNEQANWETTISNTDTASLSAGTTWTNIQAALHINNFPNFLPGTADWYSPCVGSTYANNLNYALYYQGDLVTASGGAPPSCRPLATCTPGGPAPMVSLLSVFGTVGTRTPTVAPTIDVTLGETATNTPTPVNTVTATPTASALLQLAVAAPNISRNGQPIQFMINLGANASVQLNLYTIIGEEVYSDSIEGNAGMNTITWLLKNKAQSSVATGLYIYTIEVNNGYQVTTKTGKLLVFH